MNKSTLVTQTPQPAIINLAQLQERAKALRLMGLLAHWDTVQGDPVRLGWTQDLLDWEESARAQRSLERRLRAAHIGRFKPLADFDWAWPTHCDRMAVQELMTLSFMADATNVVLVGPNGVGKSMLACNLGHQALIQGRTVLFTSAGQLLGDLAALDSDSTLRRRLRHYAAPDLLLIDEVGYLSYSNRHADLLFELISRRYEQKSTVVTTNRAFKEWGEVFPNAACVVSLVDRLVHRCEVVAMRGIPSGARRPWSARHRRWRCAANPLPRRKSRDTPTASKACSPSPFAEPRWVDTKQRANPLVARTGHCGF